MKRVLLMLVLLAATGLVGFFVGRASYRPDAGPTAYALVQVKRQVPSALHSPALDLGEFEFYRQGQAAIVKSRLVLNAALRDPKVASLSVVNNQIDPVSWLEQHITVDFPQSPEILRIGLRGPDGEALITLVQAITYAYLRETKNIDASSTEMRLRRLKRQYDNLQAAVDSKRHALEVRVKFLGNGEEALLAHMGPEFAKEMPRLLLAQTAVKTRLKNAEGSKAEELKQELEVLQAQEQMIAKMLMPGKAKRLEITPLDSEMAATTNFLNQINTKILELEFERDNPPRVTLLQEAIVAGDW